MCSSSRAPCVPGAWRWRGVLWRTGGQAVCAERRHRPRAPGVGRKAGSLGSWAMAHNPHAPQPGPEGTHDPAGSTQMFRAFVDEGEPQAQAAARRDLVRPEDRGDRRRRRGRRRPRRGRLARARLTCPLLRHGGPVRTARHAGGARTRPASTHACAPPPLAAAPAPPTGAGAAVSRSPAPVFCVPPAARPVPPCAHGGPGMAEAAGAARPAPRRCSAVPCRPPRVSRR